jgi:hypothetical protein
MIRPPIASMPVIVGNVNTEATVIRIAAVPMGRAWIATRSVDLITRRDAMPIMVIATDRHSETWVGITDRPIIVLKEIAIGLNPREAIVDLTARRDAMRIMVITMDSRSGISNGTTDRPTNRATETATGPDPRAARAGPTMDLLAHRTAMPIVAGTTAERIETVQRIETWDRGAGHLHTLTLASIAIAVLLLIAARSIVRQDRAEIVNATTISGHSGTTAATGCRPGSTANSRQKSDAYRFNPARRC